MTLRRSLLAATMFMALPLAAQAQPVTGLYVAGGAGVNWLDSWSSEVVDTRFGSTLVTRESVNFNIGWGAVGSVGWGFGNGWRIEGEVNYRNNDVSSTQFTGVSQSHSGSVGQFGLMVNLLYEFNVNWPVVPYLGAGIGWGWTRYNNVSGVSTDAAGNRFTARISGDDNQFAYQAIAGLAFPIRSVPGLAITAEYRFYATLDPTINGQIVAQTPAGVQSVRSHSLSPTNLNNSIMMGVRYNFLPPRSAPPAAIAPAPARSFLVFFDFGSDQVTARAREIITQAAQASRTQSVTRIEVAGHTDTVGSAQYNQGLSQRRANNVAAELVRGGVPREAIVTAGYGFTRPLVPTGPNVREPQNRRVEIVLR